MNLWIRSQNKKRLMKVEMVEFDKQIDGPAIIYSHEYTLGEYKTKERALEVLDEIESFIKQPTQYESRISYMNGTDMFTRKIYHMPED